MTFDWKPVHGGTLNGDCSCDMPDGARLEARPLDRNVFLYSVNMGTYPGTQLAELQAAGATSSYEARWLAEAAYIRIKWDREYKAELERLRAENAIMAKVFADMVIDSDALDLAYRNGVTRGRADTAATPTTP
jgi:hypothetical protein